MKNILTMKKWLIGAGLGLLALCGVAYGAATPGAGIPGLFIASPTGLEQINVYGSGPQIETVYLNQIRNAAGHQLVATGTTVTSAPPNSVGYLIAKGTITTWNVTLPNPAYDGELFSVANGTGSAFTSNVTVTANASGSQAQVLNTSYSGQSIAATSSVQFQFDLASLTWYEIR